MPSTEVSLNLHGIIKDIMTYDAMVYDGNDDI